ncbi:hypothetical protein HT747_16190 [Brevibacillus borstelensis]|uniref:hypothetical protein n=1 Tax=Brevibacillus borstelensis TaxID=45462 RepID=UPI0015625F74|nr:hypothetical protein [Brevibacillus borstelensis]MBE5396677.1 hypothetical protein [Brevibacillus borstelensis]
MNQFDHIAKTLETTNPDYMSAAQRKYIDDRIDRIIDAADRTAAEQAASQRTREEWEALEDDYAGDHVYIPLSWEDVEAPLLDAIDRARTDEERTAAYERYLDEIMHYETCAYVFCEGVFDTRKVRDDTKYCCPAHKKAQENASARFAKKGTYLPETAYMPKYAESIAKGQRKHERLFEPGELFEVIAWYYRQKRTVGVKRDREKDERTGTFARRKVRRNPAYDAFKRGEYEGVKYLEYGGKIYQNRPIESKKPPQKLINNEVGERAAPEAVFILAACVPKKQYAERV